MQASNTEMQVSETSAEGLRRVFRVVIPADALKSKLDEKIAEVLPKVKINGFRPGKVPASHVKKLYGASMMRDVVEEQVQTATQVAMDKASVRPASEPQLTVASDMAQVMDGAADLAFDLAIEVMPEFEPVDPASLSVVRPVADVSDAQIDEAVENLRKSNVTYTAKDGAAETGDQLTIDFIGSIDGEVFEGGSGEGAELVIGSNRFIPGFEDQLIGASAGEERTVEVSFPDDYPVDTLKGKAASFAVTVQAVAAPGEAVLDDAFAAQFGIDTLEALREALKSRLDAEHKSQSRMKAKRALFDQLDTRHTFELPAGMVDAEFAQIWQEVVRDREQGQLDADDSAKDEDTLKADYRKIAERRVRLGLVLAEIGRRSKIEVTQEEMGAALARTARNFPGRERQVYDAYAKNPGALAQLRAPIYEEKVVDYIFELAKVTDQTVSREELFAADEMPETTTG